MKAILIYVTWMEYTHIKMGDKLFHTSLVVRQPEMVGHARDHLDSTQQPKLFLINGACPKLKVAHE